MQRRWQHDQPVAGQVHPRPRPDDVHVQPELPQPAVGAEAQLQRVVVGALRLDLRHPQRVVVEHQRHVGPHRQARRVREHAPLGQRRQLRADLRGFERALVFGGIGAQQAGVHLLLRKRCLPPAEVAHHLGAVRKRLPGPQPHRAVVRRRVPVGPVHRARLLLHHPPAAVPAHAAVQVVVERRDVRVPGPCPARLFLGAEEEHLRDAERVGVPGGDVEVRRHVVVVELGEEAHEVVRHRPPRRQLAQDRHLLAVERHHLVRREPPPVEPVRRVRLGHGQRGQVDLVEAAVDLAPEHRAPGGVQRVDRRVARGQPAPEPLPRRLGQAQHGVVAAVFVVGLPGDHGGVLAVALGDRAADAARLGAVAGVREAVVPPRAEAARAALQVDRYHVRHPVHQPLRRRRGRRAHHDAEAGGVQRLDRFIQPVPGEDTRLGLDHAPREFRDPHDADAHRVHAPRVFGPLRAWPVFGVIADTQLHVVDPMKSGG